MGTQKSMPKRIVGFSLGTIAIAIAVVADVAASYFSTTITRWWSGTFTTAQVESGDTKFKAQDNAAELTETVEAEGAVLLKNGKASATAEALPLSQKNAGTVALLGYASYSPSKGGAGSVSQNSTVAPVDFYEAFDVAGFKVDKTMKTYYSKYGTANSASGQMIGGWKQAEGVNDQAFDASTNNGEYFKALNTAKANAQTAVVVLSRIGAEGGDVYTNYKSEDPSETEKHYLSLVKNELDLIEYAVKNFSKTIVLINSSHQMELGELDGTGVNAKYDVDGVIWVGGGGNTGLQAIPDIISGDVNPSGKLCDTYAYKMSTHPTYFSPTCGAYTNKDEYSTSKMTINGQSYEFNNDVDGGVAYDFEGIYVGYRWYETADAEGFWSSQFAKDTWGVTKYEDVVQYPFGYGLSYTSFDWKVKSKKFEQTHGKIQIEVEVTNTGTKAGKDVVELYYTAPYSKTSHIEKSSKVLGAFAKTAEIKPGKSDVVTLEMDVDEIASYDYRGAKCYVAEKGTYDFNLQTDSHNIKKNKDGSAVDTMKYEVATDRVYNDAGVGARSSDSAVATNHFDYSSGGDGNIGTYGVDNTKWYFASRENFEATHPAKFLGGRDSKGKFITIYELKNYAMGAAMVKYITEETAGGSDVPLKKNADGTYTFDDSGYITDSKIEIATEQKNGLKLEDLAGYKDYEDEIWDQLINQMSVAEMAHLVEECNYGSPAIESIGIGMATDVDGPAGVSSANLNYTGNTYTTEPVMASTWNTDLLYQVGVAVARECAVAGINGWYAPGANTHKNPFNGRNAEYFSEDPVLGGKICAAETKGAQDNGLYVFLKHFVCNESDQSRGGLYTWINEQELREVQLKAFEYAVKDGGGLGIMEAYNRVGCSECSTNYGLNTWVLRREWNFKGMCLTDGYGTPIGCQKYENPDVQIRSGAGQLLFLDYSSEIGHMSDATLKTETGVAMLHDAARRIAYRYANSNAFKVQRDYTPYWIGPVVGLNVVLFGGAACSIIFLGIQPKKKEKAVEEAK